MPTNRENIIKECSAILATFSAYISNLSKINLNDAAVIAESNMLDIVNYIYDMNFKDANSISLNFPGIDYIDTSKKAGMQVTLDASAKKIRSSIDKLVSNTAIKLETMWFLFLIDRSYRPEQRKHKDIKIEPITIQSIFIKIGVLPDSKLFHVRGLLNTLHLSINSTHDIHKSYMIEQATSVAMPPSFNRFAILTNEWITSQFRVFNPFFHYIFDKKVFFDSMIVFINKLYLIPKSIRSFIASIMILASPTKRAREKLRVPIKNLYYNLSDSDQKKSSDYVEYLTEIDILQIHYENPRIDDTKNNEIDAYIKYDVFIEISHLVDELDLDIFTALRFFYLKEYTARELYQAIENVDFKLLE